MTEPDPAAPAASPAPLSDLLRMADVAEMFGCCAWTIRRWCSAGHLAPVRIGRSVFFRSDDIRRLIAIDMAVIIVKRGCLGQRHGSDPSSMAASGSNDLLYVAWCFVID